MNGILRAPVVLDSFGASDISASGSYVTIVGVPRFYYPSGTTAGLLPSLVETPTRKVVTPTSISTGQNMTFTITQFNRALGVMQAYPIVYQTDSTSAPSATVICNAWRAAIAVLIAQGTLNVTTGGTSTLTIAGGTGDPIFTIQTTNPTNVVVTDGQTAVSIVSSTDATPIVVTTGASTWVVGQTVTVASHLVNTNANGTWRIAATNGTTTVTLEGSTATGGGAGGATGTVTLVPQKARGTYAQVYDVINNFNNETGSSQTLPVSGHTYATLVFNGFDSGNGFMTEQSRQSFQQTVYFYESESDYAVLSAKITNIMNGLNTAGSAAEAELFSAV